MAHGFGLGLLAIGDRQDLLIDLLAHLADLLGPGHHSAGVDIDVILQQAVGLVVACDLDHRHQGEAGGCAPAGGEADDLGAGGSQGHPDLGRELLGHAGSDLHPLGDGLDRSAALLDGDALHRLACGGNAVIQLLNGYPLTAQTHQKYRAHIGVAAQADQGAHGLVQILAVLSAAHGMGHGHGGLHLIGDPLGRVVGTENGGDHGHIVSYAEGTVFPLISHDLHIYSLPSRPRTSSIL